MRIHILIADDDPHILTLVRFYLQKEGYAVLQAEDGSVASQLLEEQKVHLAVVDVMMPGKDGLELCREIRDVYDIPVILLTAKGEMEDKEQGFLAGTDDYLVKPFEPRELLFRIKALLRRYQLVSGEVMQFGQTVIDLQTYEVRVGELVLTLPRKEFELLALLASNAGRILTREQLIQRIWGIDYAGDSRTVDVHIKRLRERLAISTDLAIVTARGLGYKLEGQEA
ncbi:response regulator transcription factor [Tumebacillus permanentifrigoris]|uniref:Heme response regulator HssR n=1 Tax=Tumebacillus permanentifrigoris TaxID=378543 RepID=A0A316DXN6_9BACL|nr:response regulator transcription factor [Tumebacillus permanentifrigoris]PWK14881.1 DNA-binding response OmpR family regulator [Tumebacillus permanentifrigoris]